jgi:hypothetical protein
MEGVLAFRAFRSGPRCLVAHQPAFPCRERDPRAVKRRIAALTLRRLYRCSIAGDRMSIVYTTMAIPKPMTVVWRMIARHNDHAQNPRNAIT